MVKNRMVKKTKKAFIVSDSVTVRWSTDVNVWPGCGAGDRLAERRIWNPVLLQKVQQRAAFGAVRMKLNIHSVAMVQVPAVVNRSLSKDCNRKLFMEGVRKELLNLRGVA